MLQKTAKKAELTNATSPGKSSKLADAARNARAVLKAIKQPTLRALRNRVLDHAIKLFSRKGGWALGSLEDWNYKQGYTNFCAIGGIQNAEGPKTAKQAAVDAVYASLPRKFRADHDEMYGFDRASAVVEFNDTSEHGKRRVINAFKRAKKQPLRKD